MRADLDAIIQDIKANAGDTVKAVLVTGAGHSFCAGGDVKAVASAVASGRPEVAFAFFKAEYKLNHLISKLTKPHIALIDGIVIGGGAGLSVHGRFRVATETTTFAMPECAIGLFTDVGFARLYRARPAEALYLGLSGARLGAKSSPTQVLAAFAKVVIRLLAATPASCPPQTRV